jgi:large subunit ribosomal protein L29
LKKSEIRELKLDELKRKETELEDQLFKLRFQLATGQIENPGMIRTVRKDIARVKTYIRERSNAGEGSPEAEEKATPGPVTGG